MNRKITKKVFLSLILAVLATGSVMAVGPLVDAEMGGAPVAKKEASYMVPEHSQVLDVKVTKPAISYVSNVVYAQVPSRGFENVALKMDILKPQVKTPLPAVVVITGGGFINANKDNYMQQRVKLAEAGYVVASIDYRVAPTAIFPQPLEDVKAAIRYLRANAMKFNIDPEHIGVWGGSAGGYLAAMAGTTSGLAKFDVGEHLEVSSSVQAVVDMYGLSDLTQIGADYSVDNQKRHMSSGATEALWVNGSPVFGGVDGGIMADLERAKAANPITYIDKYAPPFLLLHGTEDTSVSPSQTNLLHLALLAQGVDSTRYVVPGAKHGGEYWVQPEVVDTVIAFFNRTLKEKMPE